MRKVRFGRIEEEEGGEAAEQGSLYQYRTSYQYHPIIVLVRVTVRDNDIYQVLVQYESMH